MRSTVLLTSKILLPLCSFFLTTAVGFSADQDKDQSDVEKRIENAAKVLDEIMATPDKGIPDKIMGGQVHRSDSFDGENRHRFRWQPR